MQCLQFFSIPNNLKFLQDKLVTARHSRSQKLKAIVWPAKTNAYEKVFAKKQETRC